VDPGPGPYRRFELALFLGSALSDDTTSREASKPRAQWKSKFGFILAASGSAIGLGNIVFFPANAYSYGGGAFYLPYFLALFSDRDPGHDRGVRARGVHAPLVPARDAAGRRPGGGVRGLVRDPERQLHHDVLHHDPRLGDRDVRRGAWGTRTGQGVVRGRARSLADGGAERRPRARQPRRLLLRDAAQLVAGALRHHRLASSTSLLVSKGTKTIEFAVKIFVPTMWLAMIGMIVIGLSQEGGMDGVMFLFTPEMSVLKKPEVWQGAMSQMFFTLSLGFGVMTAYASYLPKKSDHTHNAITTSLLNCGFEWIAGVAIFSMLFAFAIEPKRHRRSR
jgi:NSS family neurotransmitter:Na+ symporter